jgi:hypothetical protein
MGLRMAHGFVIALVTVAVLQPLVAQAPTPPPIQRFLAANLAYRLLAVADVRDVVDEVAEEYFTPFASGDLTGDGVPEVAAVIVQRETPIRFGVVVVHGSRTVHWVRRPQSDKIVGVAIQPTRRLYIEHCLECDSNSFVRWNGSSYEDFLWIVGDNTATYDQQPHGNRPVPLRHTPNSTGKVIGSLRECTDAKILQVLPRQANGVRWYRVEVSLNGLVTEGFLPSHVLTDISCIG